MITQAQFNTIYSETEQAVNEAFDYIRLNARDSAYFTFLAEGEFYDRATASWLNLNPHTIDNRGDKFKDDTRMRFFFEYMRLFYSFPPQLDQTEDNEYNITMELMVYTHVWESKPFLKQLYRLTELVVGEAYPWKVIVPDMSKHEFIRFDIRDRLSAKQLSISDIITKGFHTSLRNAFAHSEYTLDDRTARIILDTYKGANWDIREITYNEWSVRFAYTATLCYHFSKIKAERRLSIAQDFKRKTFIIIHPKDKSTVRARPIYYDEHFDRFSFYEN